MIDKYPGHPGYQARDTSIMAAEQIAPLAKTLREQVYDVIAGRHSMTADEAADALGKSILSVRPRCAELATTGEIVDSGERRKNASGKSAIAWRVAERQMRLF